MRRRNGKPTTGRRQSQASLLRRYLGDGWLSWLLLLVPAAVLIELFGLPKLWLFGTSALALIPLAGLIGRATEELAHHAGAGVGGLLNATFGNATELIIAIFALRSGLQEVVKASISGSIIGNILLVLGVSMLLGGWGRQKQDFDRTRAGANAGMLFLAVVALVMPAVFSTASTAGSAEKAVQVEYLSLAVAGVLLLTYMASLVFSLKTHRYMFTPVTEEIIQPELPVRQALLLLALATVVTAVIAELLVDSISTATQAVGMTEFFVGVVVIAVVGNAAEHFSAVSMAMKDRMELTLTIAAGSGTQVALFVAPVLVFASLLFGQPMSLVFNVFEVVGVGLSVIGLAVVSLDGESNWFEGVQLTAIYAVLAIVFYFVPAG